MQATTDVLSHPDKQTPMRQLAGMMEAGKVLLSLITRDAYQADHQKNTH